MTRPRLLDLFCGAGGAAMGYFEAGFDVVGVDLAPQPRYPFEFHQADALTFPLEGFAAIHASPPCQAYSVATADPSLHPDLYGPTKARLTETSIPWVIENVPGAPYRSGVVLCGSMFDMKIRRHRNFETSFPLLTWPCNHGAQKIVLSVTGTGYGGQFGTRNGTKPRDLAEAQEVMGVDWMLLRELSEAIPPAYTRFIGEQLLAHLERAA